MKKWNISGWGAAQAQIREAVHFLCDGKDQAERVEVGEELVELIRAIARGSRPPEQSTALHDGRDVHFREVWARMGDLVPSGRGRRQTASRIMPAWVGMWV